MAVDATTISSSLRPDKSKIPLFCAEGKILVDSKTQSVGLGIKSGKTLISFGHPTRTILSTDGTCFSINEIQKGDFLRVEIAWDAYSAQQHASFLVNGVRIGRPIILERSAKISFIFLLEKSDKTVNIHNMIALNYDESTFTPGKYEKL